jgi:hypothetical protein
MPARCPNCDGTRRPAERFCPRCRYEFATGRRPQPPVLVPLRRPATRWELRVDTDDGYASTRAADGLATPAGRPTVVVPLERPTVVIGGMAGPPDEEQLVNLRDLTGDPGVSKVHALLSRRADGNYRLSDPGSMNGTRLNSHEVRIPRNRPTPLRDGDQIFVGAWTRLTIRRTAS